MGRVGVAMLAVTVVLASCGIDDDRSSSVSPASHDAEAPSSTTTTLVSPVTAAGDRVEVVESGWSVYGYPGWLEDQPDRYAATYGLTVGNPSDRAARSVTVRSRFLDAEGDPLGPEESETAELLLPGQTVALGRSGVDISAGSPEGHEVIDVEVGAWLDIPVRPGGFEVHHAESMSTELLSETAQVSGFVTSTFVAPVSDVEVTALFRGADGRITGGVQFTEPSRYRFEPRSPISVYTELPDTVGLRATTVEVHPRLTADSLDDLDDLAFLPPPPPPGDSGTNGGRASSAPPTSNGRRRRRRSGSRGLS